MEVRAEILIVILGGAAVTLFSRVTPLVTLARRELPEWFRAWLAYVPVAILAALLASELAMQGGAPAFKWRELIAIVPVFAIAATTRSLLGAVAAGVVAIALLRAVA
jgi:branched-subunit amino acid transport protein